MLSLNAQSSVHDTVLCSCHICLVCLDSGSKNRGTWITLICHAVKLKLARAALWPISRLQYYTVLYGVRRCYMVLYGVKQCYAVLYDTIQYCSTV